MIVHMVEGSLQALTVAAHVWLSFVRTERPRSPGLLLSSRATVGHGKTPVLCGKDAANSTTRQNRR